MIYIFSDKIHSGKTTRLIDWAGQQKGVGGLVQPIIKDKRFMLDLTSKQKVLMEADPKAPNSTYYKIGKYKFHKGAFSWGRSKLNEVFNDFYDYLIIDEVGPLEFSKIGLEPAVSLIIGYLKTSDTQHAIVVVRDSLKEKFIEHYQLQRKQYVLWEP